jgi:CheY-like chemotaxis protein
METNVVNQKTILIVEDDNNLRAIISSALEQFGFRVFSAFDAASTFAILQQNQIDLIIMDQGLPGVEGIELGAEILRQSPNSAPPIVLFTGTNDRELDRRAKAAGFVGYWIKPMGLKVIQEKIEALGL